jgi:2-keto-3-deoxy-L-rhamnonate aldolase RhmA
MHSIKERLQANRNVCVVALGALAHHKLVQVVAQHQHLHGVWIDLEHSAVPQAQLEMILLACRATGLDAFARVPPTDYATVMRPMEAGCSGIMAAQIRTVAQVRQVVEWAKYPPLGTRGLFMNNAESSYGTIDAGQHVISANRDRWIAIQIETVEAVDLADEIAAIPEVDLLFVGPADLACTLGVPGQLLHEKCISSLKRVAQAAASAGKPWGALSRNWEHARVCRDLGCQLFSIFGDVDLVHRGMAQTGSEFRELLG